METTRAFSALVEVRALIPKVAHFIWLGPGLLWVHRLALLSAAKHGGFERVVLHHDGALSTDGAPADLLQVPSIELRTLEPIGLIESVGGGALVMAALAERRRTGSRLGFGSRATGSSGAAGSTTT